ncbi:unnamed protein product [Acanthoscelides obtectus]|nr:unnamed protein product [Acanthoscelides obtectus]CAK1620794.1 hypothetical protein AOBTE_LOCUS573 [Acanthoscelides obtectus]
MSDDSTLDGKKTGTVNSYMPTNTTTTTCSERTETDDGVGSDQKIEAYVDFSDFYRNYEERKRKGTLPEGLENF